MPIEFNLTIAPLPIPPTTTASTTSPDKALIGRHFPCSCPKSPFPIALTSLDS